KTAPRNGGANLPAPAMTPDQRRSAYLNEVAPASIVGRMVKFSKEGEFITADDGQVIGEEDDYIALCDETLIGWVKINRPGGPPPGVVGLLYGDFVMPLRSSLGDDDDSLWETGLDGRPADPWQHHQYVVLQNIRTNELFTFVTSSKTGRRSVGKMLQHY